MEKLSSNKYFIFTLGCQMNKSDSEHIISVLENLGYRSINNESRADLIIANLCSVRQSAIDRIWGKIKIWNSLKKKNPNLIIALTGCILEEDRKKFQKNPTVDLIFDIKDLSKLPKILSDKKLAIKNERNKPDRLSPIVNYFDIMPKYKSKFSAYIPISTGCNNYCSYCVVPYTRGREISRPAEEIISEVKDLIKKGYKEIFLLGQNVNSYGKNVQGVQPVQNVQIEQGRRPIEQAQRLNNLNKENKLTFYKLLQEINSIPGHFWIRFLTSHPKDMSKDLINTIAQCEKVTGYIHLPVQSGDDEILRRMNRGYNIRGYLLLIKAIRAKIPLVSLSTDVIVGFPDETKKQFENTKRLMEKVKFDMAYIAQYSPRPGTAAYKLKDDVPKKEKKRREKILTEILKKTALENNRKYIGKEVEVLAEESNKKKAIRDKKSLLLITDRLLLLFGHTRTFKPVQFYGPENLISKFVKVKITNCTPWGLEGELVK